MGITKAHDDEEPRAAVELAFRHDEKILVEEFVAGVEVEVGVLGNREPFASLVGEIAVTHNEWYDYVAKYDEGEMDLIVPARITAEQASASSSWPSRRSWPPSARGWPASTASCGTTARCSSTS